jgi:Protein of unknown function (DUF2800)
MSFHAKLSPSASHIWMNCPGSIALIGDDSSTTTQAAMLGTAAHKLVEIMIREEQEDASIHHGATLLVKADGDEETEYYPPGAPALDPEVPRPGWFMFIADEKMVEGVQQTIDEVGRIKAELFAPKVYSEVYLDGSWLDSRLGGTIDVRIVECFGWLHIVDHKNGVIIVEAKDNDQLKQYAMLAAHEHPECEGVTVTISQPNAPHVEGTIRSESYTIDELKLYEIRVKEAAEATSKPNAPRRAGDWCLWCPAKTRCKEFDEMMAEEARADFSEDEPPASLPLPQSTDELNHKAQWIDVIRAWCNNIEAAIQTELENGNTVGDWKLVRGRAKRRIMDPVWTVTRLTSTDPEELGEDVPVIGLSEADLYVEPKLKSPAQLEKLGVGKEQRKLVKAAVKELAFMPAGKLTIAPGVDPREAVTSFEEAASEFDDDDEEDF